MPVLSWRCRSSYCARILTSWAIATADWPPTAETLIPSSHSDQSVEHILHRRQHSGIGGIGVLQRQKSRHLLIDIDARTVIEPLLQRIQHHVLSVLEVGRGTGGLALCADDLAQERRDRA